MKQERIEAIITNAEPQSIGEAMEVARRCLRRARSRGQLGAVLGMQEALVLLERSNALCGWILNESASVSTRAAVDTILRETARERDTITNRAVAIDAALDGNTAALESFSDHSIRAAWAGTKAIPDWSDARRVLWAELKRRRGGAGRKAKRTK